MKIVFMGTPDFAVPVLKKLINEHEVICVYTRAPKPAGRGKQLCKSPVHELAESLGIEVRTPKNFRDEAEKAAFKTLNADVTIVAAYGLILPKAVIEAFPFGCLNVHGSLLPRWRGAAPIQRSIEAGDQSSGVTIMQVVEELDAGAMYLKHAVEITPQMTGGDLHDRLSVVGANLMAEVLAQIENLTPQNQNPALVTYAAKLEKSESRINFMDSASVLERRIRAFNPFPGSYFEYEGERFKILGAQISEQSGKPGEILSADKQLVIACGEKALNIITIQRQGKKPMPIETFLKGFAFAVGKIIE